MDGEHNSVQIGEHRLRNAVALAPMAGLSDKPFRITCFELGAGLTVSEMVGSEPRYDTTVKTRQRLDLSGTPRPRSVQIAGSDPQFMADRARECVALGADIIDINMGCPAKKVCNKLAGSALLRDEELVGRIISAVVGAVAVPVTLKMRTGWDPANRNGVAIARLAEGLGVRMLAVHGRTRACRYKGTVEYRTIAGIKRAVDIPVLANGDIDSPEAAVRVLGETGADGVMIGRSGLGNPWLFRDIAARLAGEPAPAAPDAAEIGVVARRHVAAMHEFYGEVPGVRVARKHIAAYLGRIQGGKAAATIINQISSASGQRDALDSFFAGTACGEDAA
ncbi:MAG: tRNA dihydrouridine synthase DusB [Gammaproteobacteria bacterium]|nr:tRNA dihydrouridine synthase DusB [Gammaproteobacteria bacterium]NNM01161.1 tRNA dihydrouridine synthase DusB [Gammaproteobacteria bacterium]